MKRYLNDFCFSFFYLSACLHVTTSFTLGRFCTADTDSSLEYTLCSGLNSMRAFKHVGIYRSRNMKLTQAAVLSNILGIHPTLPLSVLNLSSYTSFLTLLDSVAARPTVTQNSSVQKKAPTPKRIKSCGVVNHAPTLAAAYAKADAARAAKRKAPVGKTVSTPKELDLRIIPPLPLPSAM